MKPYIALTLLIILAALFSCSGDDPIDVDLVPPVAPRLIPHLGDTGDIPYILDGQLFYPNDDNNGIDAVSEGNWIKVPWRPFVDDDLSHLKIYRFSQSNPTPVYLNTVPYTDPHYLDQSSLIEREWYSYFIELYDASGNYSVSDTVSYAILAKSILTSPANGETVSLNNLWLQWDRGDSDTTDYRVLVWNENDQLIYSTNYAYAPTQDPPLPPQVPFPVLTPSPPSGSILRWRVDAFDLDVEFGGTMGSESFERTFVVQ